ncbi:MAG: hypothetical protein ACK5Q1_00530, partial [Limnobacter sp.]
NNDGVYDNGTLDDADGDGAKDDMDNNDDNDELADRLTRPDGSVVVDTDRNNNGVDNNRESELGETQNNRDGDYLLDADDTDDTNDGIDDERNSLALQRPDSDDDGDGIANRFDTDDDNDGAYDENAVSEDGTLVGSTESDSDGDGLSDDIDTDDDNNGVSDEDQAGTDVDGDGLADNADTQDSPLPLPLGFDYSLGDDGGSLLLTNLTGVSDVNGIVGGSLGVVDGTTPVASLTVLDMTFGTDGDADLGDPSMLLLGDIPMTEALVTEPSPIPDADASGNLGGGDLIALASDPASIATIAEPVIGFLTPDQMNP